MGVFAGLALTAGAGGISAGPVVHRYPMPHPASGAVQMGGDWTEQWFASPDTNGIARLRSDGSIEDIPLPTPNSRPLAVARESWSHGWVVFTEIGANRIGVRFSNGELHEFDIPTAASDPRGITAPGPVYFTEYAGNKIGQLRVGSSFPIYEVAIPTPNSGPLGITIGPGLPNSYDIWFTESLANKIGRLDQYGVITEYAIPTPDSGPTAIVSGTFGDESVVYFLESKANKIGRITAAGVVTELAVPTPESGLSDIVADYDAVWFSERDAGKLGRISRDGEIREFPLPPGSAPTGIGITRYTPDLREAPTSIWYLDSASGRVGRLSDNLIYAVGAGYGEGWDTEFAVSSIDGQPPQTRVGLELVGVCPMSCPDRGIILETPAGTTVGTFASRVPYSEGLGLYRVSSYYGPAISDLPDTAAWIVDPSHPETRAELPLVDYWTVADAQPGAVRSGFGPQPVLTFPAHRSPGVHTDIVIAALETDASYRLRLLVEAFSPAEGVLASSTLELWEENVVLLDDVLEGFGLDRFEGQIRVTRESAGGLFWGVARIDSNGELTLVAPKTSSSRDPELACCRPREPRLVTRD